ncbi:MAG: chemotaxis protein CheB [Minicystis sp.]
MKPEEPARACDVVVIGASAGGLEALMRLLAELPADLPARIAIVFHRNRFTDGQILPILQRRSTLPVTEPATGSPFATGGVYLAPRDHHLEVEDGIFRLDRGPELHHLRPAADRLFVTAAEIFGPRVLGVVLSGGGFDGARGCLAIHERGGLVMVQAPEDASFPFMPEFTIAEDDVDLVLPIAEMAAAITALVRGEAVKAAKK